MLQYYSTNNACISAPHGLSFVTFYIPPKLIEIKVLFIPNEFWFNQTELLFDQTEFYFL